MVETLKLLTGVDLPMQSIPVVLHQPTIYELSHMGEKNYSIAAQSLCINKNMISADESVLANLNNFQIFMKVMKDAKDKKRRVLDLLFLLFPNYKVLMTPQSIIVGEGVIDEKNFEELQEMVKAIFCLGTRKDDQSVLNPVGKKAKEIAEKIMRGRQRVAAQKGESSILSQYLSVLAIGNSLSLKEVASYTIFQVFDQIERFGLHTNWDIDIKSRLAGAKVEGKPEDWMKNIH